MGDWALKQLDEVRDGSHPLQSMQRSNGHRTRRRSAIGLFRDAVTARITLLHTLFLGVVVVGSLLAVGTVHAAVLVLVAATAFLGLAIGFFTEPSWRERMPAPAWVLFGLAVYSWLQSLPLPITWLQRLSPGAARIWLDAQTLAGTAKYTAAPLSVDPGATQIEALKWLTYAAVFILATLLARRCGSKRGIGIVVASGVLGGLLTIIHGLFGVERWLGIYEPQFVRPTWALSPLLNTNNFSGYLNLATYCAVGLSMTRRPRVPRWLMALSAAILFGLSILTGSRGGVLALLVGAALFALVLREQNQHARLLGAPRLPKWLPLIGTVTVGLTLFLLGTNDIIWDQLLDETASKLRILSWTEPMIRDFRWFGVGRGAYETVSSTYRDMGGLATYQHAENFIVDWLAEWGVGVSVLALGTFLWLFRPRRLGFLRHPVPTAALIGVVVLLLQNLVDLGLEVAAVGIALVAVLGSVWGGALRHHDREWSDNPSHRKADVPERTLDAAAPLPRDTLRRRPHRHPLRTPVLTRRAWVAALLVLACAGALIAQVTRSAMPTALDERQSLHDLIMSTHWNDPQRVAQAQNHVRRALLRHPADSYVPLLGALVAQNTRKNELPWLNQALRRDPLNARAELLLADSLALRGAVQQALAVLKRCAIHEPNLANVVAERASRYTQKLPELMRAVPDGQTGVDVLNALAMYTNKPQLRAIHAALLQASLARKSDSPITHGLIIDDLLSDLADPTGVCSGPAQVDCERQLEQHARVVEAQGPGSLQAVILHSRLLVRQGKSLEAAQWLAKSCRNFTTDLVCAAQFVTVASQVSNLELLDEAGNAYLALACSTPDACAAAATWIGNLYAARGSYDSALSRFERAVNESPSADAWLRVADSALRSGHPNRAQSALLAARRFGAPTDSELEKRVQTVRREQMLHDSLK